MLVCIYTYHNASNDNNNNNNNNDGLRPLRVRRPVTPSHQYN